MNKIENYLGIANHDIQMANNSQELKSYVASILCENDKLQKENEELKEQLHDASIQIQEQIEKDIWCPSNCEKLEKLQKENEKLKDNWIKLKEYIRKNIIYDDVGMKILDSSPLEDYMQELEQGSDNK